MYGIDGGIAGLAGLLDEDWFEIQSEGTGTIGEVFVDRIEPGEGGLEHPIPGGYGENGIWVRGRHDYAERRVSGASLDCSKSFGLRCGGSPGRAQG